ncbi:MAG TPA: NUDIX domain-containing protein [Candidatus Binatia bacterium]|nr:NUDIX domain-containing protein [Candidatus Binatia bacterium]
MPSSRASAGLLMYRQRGQALEVLLAHPGGPFFKNKDDGHWTIPKGEIESEEEFLSTAIREFREEIGIDIDPSAKLIDLGSIRQKGGKVVSAWAVEGDWPAGHHLRSNVFKMEWPPKSGKFQEFPEIDRAEFFPIESAKLKIKAAQIPFLDRLEAALA